MASLSSHDQLFPTLIWLFLDYTAASQQDDIVANSSYPAYVAKVSNTGRRPPPIRIWGKKNLGIPRNQNTDTFDTLRHG